MADPVDAAASNDADLDDLYADLDVQVAAALAAAGESGGSNARDSDPATDGEGEVPGADTVGEAVDLGDGHAGYSSSEESEDDIHIVLNEDGGASPRPSAVRCEERSEEGEVLGNLVKGPCNDELGKFSGLHCKGFLEKRTAPIIQQGDGGQQHAFQKDSYFFLPRNRTVFDINIEAFQQKPWRQPGVDLTDYFNFGLDEEGWTRYCFGMPKGKAIHVEAGVHERFPSSDMWCPRERDSDVVIQINTMLSPSSHSTSDDSSTVNYKHVTTERISINNPGNEHVKDISCMVDRVDKEVQTGGSLDCTGSKLDMRDSAYTREQSSSFNYSGMLSKESAKDCYFKRVHGRSNSNTFHEDINLKDVHVESDFCHHLRKSDQQSKKGGCHSGTPSSNYDRYHKTKLLRTDEPPFVSGAFLIHSRSDRRLLKYVHKATRGQKRQGSVGGRHAVFEKEREEKITENYPGWYARKHGQKRSSSTPLHNSNHNAFHNEACEKQERMVLGNDAEYFSNNSTHQRRHSSWHEINDDEDVECFSSAKEWKQHHDFESMLKADLSGGTDGWMYRERHYQETRRLRRVRHGHCEDEEFLRYSDFRFAKLQSPLVTSKYRNRRLAGSIDEHLKHRDHFMLSPRANDYLKNSEGGWPSAGLTFKSSRNRCIDKKRIQNAKMMLCCRDEDHKKNKHRDSSFRVDNIRQSVLYTGAAAETGCSVLPVKRSLHGDLVSMNYKDLVGLPYPKGRRLMHNQSMANDRKLYALEAQNCLEGIDREAICGFDDTRNNKTISNICDERRHKLLNFQGKDIDSINLNNRKRKLSRQGNEINRKAEIDNIGHRHAEKDLQQKVRKFKTSYHHSGNQDLEKPTHQRQKNVVDINEDELEEGELIDQDNQDTVSKVYPIKPRKAVLKSVIEATSGQLGLINAMSKDVVCSKGAKKECDDKHILEVMEKMQKRRERFSEPITQKEEGDGRKELLDVTCGADDIKNQRPARKRRWGGSG